MQRILETLARHGVKGTFFVVGWIASRFPRLVRDVQDAGHEVGSHGYWHRLVYSQTPEQFRQDLRDSKAAIEDAIGTSVGCYRAPTFSITRRSLWALEILVEEGFTADSSIFPVRHHRYGIVGGERGLHRVRTQSGDLWEFPPAVVRAAGRNFAVGGGGYFRLLPLWLTQAGLRRIDRSFMFYIHPWELDPGQPRLPAGTRRDRFRHYVGLSGTGSKLDRLLPKFRFGTLSQAIEQCAARSPAELQTVQFATA